VTEGGGGRVWAARVSCVEYPGQGQRKGAHLQSIAGQDPVLPSSIVELRERGTHLLQHPAQHLAAHTAAVAAVCVLAQVVAQMLFQSLLQEKQQWYQ